MKFFEFFFEFFAKKVARTKKNIPKSPFSEIFFEAFLIKKI
jgi:hypothetical protein